MKPVLGHFTAYAGRLNGALATLDWAPVLGLAEELLACWRDGRQVFLAGNGGSAGNANHLANDLLYSVSQRIGSGIRAEALTANPAVITCLANDTGFDRIFAAQMAVKARAGDVLVVFSGSGNSANVLLALEEARRIGLRSYALLGFSGGRARELADVPIHVAVDDMQVAEDVHLVIGHMVVQWLQGQRDRVAG